MKKIVTVLGARPQFIKASAISSVISLNTSLAELVVHTGQHHDANMSDIFFDELGLKRPEYHLNVHGGEHGEMTGRMMIELERVLIKEKPDLILVYGDTNSTLAGALVGAKLQIPIAHVEAGLRSFNMGMPEEINRIVTDRLSALLFAPTEIAVRNLRSEGVKESKVFLVGDVMFDVSIRLAEKGSARRGILDVLKDQYAINPHEYCLVTIHRAENTDSAENLNTLVSALNEFSSTIPVVWPVHPRTRKALIRYGCLEGMSKRVILLDPVGYLDMAQIEKHAALIASDSGGVQKEAFFYQVPCLTLRRETEWMELVDAGWNAVVPTISKESLLFALKGSLGKRGRKIAPYGHGNSAKLIVDVISDFLKNG